MANDDVYSYMGEALSGAMNSIYGTPSSKEEEKVQPEPEKPADEPVADSTSQETASAPETPEQEETVAAPEVPQPEISATPETPQESEEKAEEEIVSPTPLMMDNKKSAPEKGEHWFWGTIGDAVDHIIESKSVDDAAQKLFWLALSLPIDLLVAYSKAPIKDKGSFYNQLIAQGEKDKQAAQKAAEKNSTGPSPTEPTPAEPTPSPINDGPTPSAPTPTPPGPTVDGHSDSGHDTTANAPSVPQAKTTNKPMAELPKFMESKESFDKMAEQMAPIIAAVEPYRKDGIIEPEVLPPEAKKVVGETLKANPPLMGNIIDITEKMTGKEVPPKEINQFAKKLVEPEGGIKKEMEKQVAQDMKGVTLKAAPEKVGTMEKLKNAAVVLKQKAEDFSEKVQAHILNRTLLNDHGVTKGPSKTLGQMAQKLGNTYDPAA